MKKIIFNAILASAIFTNLNAEIYTGTSIVAGGSSLGTQVRLDQYIGSTDYKNVYAKVGIAQEVIETNDPIDSTTSVVAGIGVNVFDTNGFFIDLSAEYYLQVAGGAKKGNTFTDEFANVQTVAKDVDHSSPAASVGVGYSYKSWSFRIDYIKLFNIPDVELVSGWTSTQADRDLAGLGITYWW